MSAGGAALVTVEECPNCGVRLKRPFEPGDYVDKPGGLCRFCGARMYVRAIYAEQQPKGRRGLRP